MCCRCYINDKECGNFGTVTEVNAGTKDKGSIEGGALAPIYLGSEFVVTLIIQLCCAICGSRSGQFLH